MLGLESGQQWTSLPRSAEDVRDYFTLAERRDSRGPSAGLLVAGVVVVGLGFLAWSYLGPDLKRYMKIHSM